MSFIFDNFEQIEAYADISYRSFYHYTNSSRLIYNKVYRTNQIQIFYNIQGDQIIELNGVKFKIIPGDMIICSDWTHIMVSNLPEDAKFNIVQYDPGIFMRKTLLEPYFDSAVETPRKYSSIVLHPPKQTDKQIRKLFSKYDKHSGFGFEILRFSTLLKIIETINDFLKTLPEPDYTPPKALEVIDYINLHFDEDIKLSDIAAELGITKQHLGVIFKEFTNITPKQYIDYLRINIAKLTIKSPETNINDAFLATGYSSRSSFCRIFKKLTGQTPDEYKRFYYENPRFFYNQDFLDKTTDAIPEDLK